jgi:hypothetical protein
MKDDRGYTHVSATIQIELGQPTNDSYRVWHMTRDGWAALTNGSRWPKGSDGSSKFSQRADADVYDEAVERAVAILFGVEDHG